MQGPEFEHFGIREILTPANVEKKPDNWRRVKRVTEDQSGSKRKEANVSFCAYT